MESATHGRMQAEKAAEALQQQLGETLERLAKETERAEEMAKKAEGVRAEARRSTRGSAPNGAPVLRTESSDASVAPPAEDAAAAGPAGGATGGSPPAKKPTRPSGDRAASGRAPATARRAAHGGEKPAGASDEADDKVDGGGSGPRIGLAQIEAMMDAAVENEARSRRQAEREAANLMTAFDDLFREVLLVGDAASEWLGRADRGKACADLRRAIEVQVRPTARVWRRCADGGCRVG